MKYYCPRCRDLSVTVSCLSYSCLKCGFEAIVIRVDENTERCVVVSPRKARGEGE